MLAGQASGSMSVGVLEPGEVAEEQFGRPAGVINARFAERCVCIGAKTAGGELAGFLWLSFEPVRELLVRCVFVPEPYGVSSWDFDVFVAPRYRLGRTFSRLWDEAFDYLRRRGVRTTISWIEWGNAPSKRAHARMGAVPVGWAVFLRAFGSQIAVSSGFPYLHVSRGKNRTLQLHVSSGGAAIQAPLPHEFVARQEADTVPGAVPSLVDSKRPVAVVVGLCGHALAIIRALAQSGVSVLALESNHTLPGWSTRLCSTLQTSDIQGDGLVDVLLEVRGRLGGLAPVLFVTNDRMIRTIAKRARELEGHYRLSWLDSAGQIMMLTEKTWLRQYSQAMGLRHPVETIIESSRDLETLVSGFRFPVIAKPALPLSGFKVIVANSPDDLLSVSAQERMQGSFPLVIQEFIPGGDELICFGALYLRNGTPIARFEGRKLKSRPMGHSTIAISEPSDEVHRAALRFFAGSNISGPVSLKLKRGPDGSLWVIEPTVGRTDFWVDLCTRNGVNLPVIEYVEQAYQEVAPSLQTSRCVWINEERDPLAVFWLAIRHPRIFIGNRKVFLFFHPIDPGPWRRMLVNFSRSLVRRAWARFGRGFT